MKWAGSLGYSLIRLGQAILVVSIGVRYHVFPYQEMIKLFEPTGLIYFDLKYQTTDIETFRKIIELDWLNRKPYLKDIFDCDDYALAFKVHLSEIYRINAIAVVVGEVRDTKTGQVIGYHGYNRIIDKDKKVWLFEPQTDKLSEGNIIGNWIYDDLMRFL